MDVLVWSAKCIYVNLFEYQMRYTILLLLSLFFQLSAALISTMPLQRPAAYGQYKQSLLPLRMRIDYGQGYDPRNRPKLRTITESYENNQVLDYKHSLSLPELTQKVINEPTVFNEKICQTPESRVIHDGVILLKISLDLSKNEETKIMSNIRYCSSGYDPATRNP